MSVEASNTAKSSITTGFWPKVVLSVVIMLAAFMYIRSLAHKDQTVKQGESSVTAAVSQAKEEVDRATSNKNESLPTDTSDSHSTKIKPSIFAKIGEAVVSEKVESTESSSESMPQKTVSMASSKDESSADRDAVASSTQQAVAETESVLPEGLSPAVPTGPATVVTSPGSISTSTDQTDEDTTTAAVKPESLADEKVSDTVVVSKQKSTVPSPKAGELPVIEKEVREEAVVQAPSAETQAAEAVSVDSDTVTLPETDKAPKDEAYTSEMTSSEGTAAGSRAVPLEQSALDYAPNTRRPPFRELFGYERPKPPVQRQHYETRKPFTADNFERQELYPYSAPWPYTSRQRAWGGGYPGQYGPYSNYGGFPAYPNMPDRALYQPYGYGPSGY